MINLRLWRNIAHKCAGGATYAAFRGRTRARKHTTDYHVEHAYVIETTFVQSH